jgi:hypothetical protein
MSYLDDAPVRSAMKHHLRTLHPVLVPAGGLFAAFVVMLSVAQDGDQRVLFIQMASGIAILVSVWLLLRQYLDTLIIGAQGFDGTRRDVDRLNWIHRREIAEYERMRIAGPPTPGPEGHTP